MFTVRFAAVALLIQLAIAPPLGAVMLHSVSYNPSPTSSMVNSWVDGKDLRSGQFAFTDVSLQGGSSVTEFRWWGSRPDASNVLGFRLNIWGHDGALARPSAFIGAGAIPAFDLPNMGWLHQETVYQPFSGASGFRYEALSDGMYQFSLTLENPFIAGSDGTYWFSLHAGLSGTSSPWAWAQHDGVSGLSDWYESFSPTSDGARTEWSTLHADLACQVIGEPAAAAVPEPATLALVAVGLGGLGLARLRDRR